MVTPGIASEYLTARLSCLYIFKKYLASLVLYFVSTLTVSTTSLQTRFALILLVVILEEQSLTILCNNILRLYLKSKQN